MEQWNELAGGQATATTQPCELPRHEPSFEVERILMMDFASTPARAKGVAPTVSREEGHAESVVARPLKASPSPTADGLDKM
jgi:hypothetical protein